MKRNYIIFLAIFIFLGTAAQSNAMNFTFGSSGSFEFGGIGLGNYSVEALIPKPLELDVNASPVKLDFFKVTLSSLLAAGAGKVNATIDLLNGPLKDEGGYFGVKLGPLAFGKILWGAPQKIGYGKDGTLELDLFDINRFGVGSSFYISGTIRNIKNPTSIPEPGAMLTLGIVLFGLVAVSRKRFNEKS